MGELINALHGLIAALWPLQRVDQWEAGILMSFGRVKKLLGPGVYWVWWYVQDVQTVSLVEALINAGRQDVTLEDGSVVTYSVSATARVVDPIKAHTTVDSYKETTQELLAAVVADELSKLDTTRLTPEKRNGVLRLLTKRVNEESAVFGIEVSKVRFASFVHRARTLRVIMDREHQPLSW